MIKVFSYNSKHKVVVGILIILWAAYSFSGRRKENVYSEEGVVLQSGNFKDGKNHGKWVWYYANGKKKMEGYFNMGSREGEWFTYGQRENILTKSNYVNDKLEGASINYNNEGQIISTLLYKDDKVIKKY